MVTGSAGRIGRSTVSELQASGVAVRGLDRVATPGLAGVEEQVVGDISDKKVLEEALDGVDAVIHLAATPDDDDFESRLLPNNIRGAHELLELAVKAGVRRLVLASSGQVNWWQQMRGPWPVRVEDPISPRYWYAATKMFLEAAGRAFTEQFDVEVLVGRLGWCPRNREHVETIKADPIFQDVYLSPQDAGRFFMGTLTASFESRYNLVFATSRPIHQARLDLAPAERLLDYRPSQQWPEGID